MTQTKLVHVPYKGAGPLMVDLLAGQVDLAFDGMGTSSVQIKAGKLIPLAITSAKRNPVLPDVPTVHEAGVPATKCAPGTACGRSRGPRPQSRTGVQGNREGHGATDLKKIWAEQGADPGGMPPPR